MAKKLTIWLIIAWFFLFLAQNVSAGEGVSVAGQSAELEFGEFEYKPIIDFRVMKLRAYMGSRQAPLTEYAEIFVKQADKYNLDWRLVAAISGVESNFGRYIPINSYNAWGWANGKYRFQSWEVGIEEVTKSLRERYYQRGLLTPRQIGPVYAPPSPQWAGKVQYFIDKFETAKIPAVEQLALKL